MSLDYAILGFLSEEPQSGYDLKTRCFELASHSFWAADQAQIYRTLDKLQQNRWVDVAIERTPGRPDRKIFSLTDEGIDKLEEWVTRPLPLPPVKDPFIAQVYFGESLTDEDLLDLLERQLALHRMRITVIEHQLRGFEQRETLARTNSERARSIALKRAALRGALEREESAVRWITDFEDMLRKKSIPQPPRKRRNMRAG